MGEKTFLGWKYFCFYRMFKTNYSKFGGHRKIRG